MKELIHTTKPVVESPWGLDIIRPDLNAIRGPFCIRNGNRSSCDSNDIRHHYLAFKVLDHHTRSTAPSDFMDGAKAFVHECIPDQRTDSILFDNDIQRVVGSMECNPSWEEPWYRCGALVMARFHGVVPKNSQNHPPRLDDGALVRSSDLTSLVQNHDSRASRPFADGLLAYAICGRNEPTEDGLISRWDRFIFAEYAANIAEAFQMSPWGSVPDFMQGIRKMATYCGVKYR